MAMNGKAPRRPLHVVRPADWRAAASLIPSMLWGEWRDRLGGPSIGEASMEEKSSGDFGWWRGSRTWQAATAAQAL